MTMPSNVSPKSMPSNNLPTLSNSKCVPELFVMRASASFACGDIRGKHQPSLSSLEFSSMLATWVDNRKCTEYEHELIHSSGLNFKAVALKQRSSEDDPRASESERSGALNRFRSRKISVSSEHLEELLAPASDSSHDNWSRKRNLTDAAETSSKFPRYAYTDLITPMSAHHRKI
jgi:hypothetical protein